MQKRILFVDDEVNVLQGLRRMLNPMRHEWEMVFVASGQEALALLAQAPCDVIVSDMRMPGMDGTQLLTQVMERFPLTVRIILSGYADSSMTAKLLQLVNSAFFGLRRHVSSPVEAVKLLGLDTIKALTLSMQIFSHFDQKQEGAFALDVLWQHSLATSICAKRIAQEEQ